MNRKSGCSRADMTRTGTFTSPKLIAPLQIPRSGPLLLAEDFALDFRAVDVRDAVVLRGALFGALRVSFLVAIRPPIAIQPRLAGAQK